MLSSAQFQWFASRSDNSFFVPAILLDWLALIRALVQDALSRTPRKGLP